MRAQHRALANQKTLLTSSYWGFKMNLGTLPCKYMNFYPLIAVSKSNSALSNLETQTWSGSIIVYSACNLFLLVVKDEAVRELKQ